MAAIRKQKTKTNSGITAKEILTMGNNYYRITAYHPEKDISIIMDSFGLFEKKWQFSADLIKKGFKIIEVSDDSQFIDVNIEKLTVEEPDKFILRAYADGNPEHLEKTIDGTTYKAVKVGEKIYIPNN